MIPVLLAVFGGYFVSSMVLLKHPTLIHKRKQVKFICRHISHRGGSGENYENTIVAFKRAVETGTDMLEIDCQLTKDNQVVVSHDDNLSRTTGLNVNISEMDFKDIPSLREIIPVDFDPGVSFHSKEDETERRIPLLSEVFRQFPKVPMNIDIKRNSDKLIQEVDRLIRAHNREEITVWGSLPEEINDKCYQQNPKTHLLFSLRKAVRLVILFYTGLLPFVPLRETHLEIFHPSMYLQDAWRDNKHANSEAMPFVASLPPFLIYTLDKLLMRKCLFQHLNKRGIQTYVWVINQESEFKKLYDLGITGIMTDYPTKLQKFLSENPSYSVRANGGSVILDT